MREDERATSKSNMKNLDLVQRLVAAEGTVEALVSNPLEATLELLYFCSRIRRRSTSSSESKEKTEDGFGSTLVQRRFD